MQKKNYSFWSTLIIYLLVVYKKIKGFGEKRPGTTISDFRGLPKKILPYHIIP